MDDIRSLISRGDFAGAECASRERLATHPDDAVAHFLLALVLWRNGRTDAALDSARSSLDQAPADAGLLSDLGNLLRELCAHTAALSCLDRSLELRPGHSGASYNRALALEALGREDEALQALEPIEQGSPLFAKARFLRGTIHQDFGDMAAAEADFRSCLAADPGHAAAWYALAQTRRFEPGAAIVRALRERLENDAARPENRHYYHFALAKVLDDGGDHDAAAEQLLQANDLVQAGYEPAAIETRLNSLRAQFRDPPAAPAVPGAGPRPVFIVGMPRSGSTLVESLLARHPQVMGLGELETLEELVRGLPRPPRKQDPQDAGRRYLDALPPETRHAAVVLDKMPSNFWRLGHVATMLPGAQIIHCRRDPRDVAISNFFNLYETGNNFAYRLDHLAHYCACHDAVMAHWQGLIGDRIFSVDYADLVADPAGRIKAALAFLGLGWTESMLERPAERRRIRTASLWQVRQDVYGTSVNRWERYPRLAGAFESHYRRYTERLSAA